MLRVIEYFAKSLKITENGTFRKLWYCFLFAFNRNYGRIGIFSRFDTIHERDSQPPSQPDTAQRHSRGHKGIARQQRCEKRTLHGGDLAES